METRNRNVSKQIQEMEDLLCKLALEWRSAPENREEIKEKYHSTVKLLFSLGWNDYVDLECELPTKDMPEEYYRRKTTNTSET